MTEERVPMKDEDYLQAGMELRHDIVSELTTNSDGVRNIPKDNETLNVIRGMLKDQDSSVYTKRRVMTEEVGVENDKRAADLIELALGRVGKSTRDGAIDNNAKGPKIDESQLPVFEITNGATSHVGDEVDLDEIQRDGRRIRKGMDSED